MTKVGRPTDYTPELGDAICAKLSMGISLIKICAADDMPCERSVYRWLREHLEFSQNYARAREDQADYMVDEMIDIADTEEDVQRARVKIDTRKWAASKLKPKKYGDRVINHLVGEDGGPVKTETELTASDKLKGLLEGIAGRSKANDDD